MQRYHYESGLPFSYSLATALDSLIKQVRENNKACSICVDGAIGSGKTILAVQLADYMNGAYTKDGENHWSFNPEKAIDFKENYGMGSKNFLKNLLICAKKGHRVLIFDEAGDFSKRGSLTKLNADINRAFEICRKFKIIIIIVLPNFFYLDRSIFDKQMIKALFRVNRQSNSYATWRLWGADGIDLIKYYTTKIPIPSQAYNIVRAWNSGNTLPLTEERGCLLEDIGAKSKQNELSRLTEIDTTKFWSCAMIGKEYSVSKMSANRFVNDYDIKVAKVENRTNFYNKYDIEKAVQKYGIGRTK